MKGSIKLFRIFGIEIKLHFSWWLIFALLAWNLSSYFFPSFYPQLSTKAHWFMGIIASLLLFVSVFLHELSHSLVAQAKKIKVENITLFFFGGVAGITEEKMKPTQEIALALAGPFFSLFLAFLFFLIFKFNSSLILQGIVFYLYQLNLLLAIFNLVPAYPLDGGRVLRAVLYAYYGDLKKATYRAAQGGKFFAGFLIFLGFFSLIIWKTPGLWFILLGGFLYFIAGVSYEQVVVREVLSQINLKNILEKKFPFLKPETLFSQALKKSFFEGQDVFIIQKKKKFLGILDLKKISSRQLSKGTKRKKVKELMLSSSQIKPLNFKSTGYQAFRSLLAQDLEMLPIIEKSQIKGVVSRKRLVHYLILNLRFSSYLKKEKLFFLSKEVLNKKKLRKV